MKIAYKMYIEIYVKNSLNLSSNEFDMKEKFWLKLKIMTIFCAV